MAAALLALAFLALVAIDLLRDRRVDLRPVLTHPRWLLVAPAAGALASALARDPLLFLIACALIGAAAALLCERFHLTENGIECRGVLFAWHTLRLRRRRLFVDVRTTRGQRLRLPRWMDGLGTLTRMAGGITLR
ncbi:MAG: hypothetical protein AUI90_12895 [Deltaproteobacteria bacterium 13_1_40CM_3_69_14]|nr:MAG: hypothetical protein AUI90_12895 [Deltaproteobacteria bacterium 13_1_40CM_3_69_14]